MKKLLSILAAVGMTATAGIAVVACSDKGGTQNDEDSYQKLFDNPFEVRLDSFNATHNPWGSNTLGALYASLWSINNQPAIGNGYDKQNADIVKILTKGESLTRGADDGKNITVDGKDIVLDEGQTDWHFNQVKADQEIKFKVEILTYKTTGEGENKKTEVDTRHNVTITIKTSEAEIQPPVGIKVNISGITFDGVTIGDSLNVIKDNIQTAINHKLSNEGIVGKAIEDTDYKVTGNTDTKGEIKVESLDVSKLIVGNFNISVDEKQPTKLEINYVTINKIETTEQLKDIDSIIQKGIKDQVGVEVDNTDYTFTQGYQIGLTGQTITVTATEDSKLITGSFTIEVVDTHPWTPIEKTIQEKFTENIKYLNNHSLLKFNVSIKDGKEDKADYVSPIQSQLKEIFTKHSQELPYSDVALDGVTGIYASELPHGSDAEKNGGLWVSPNNATMFFNVGGQKLEIECNYSINITKIAKTVEDIITDTDLGGIKNNQDGTIQNAIFEKNTINGYELALSNITDTTANVTIKGVKGSVQVTFHIVTMDIDTSDIIFNRFGGKIELEINNFDEVNDGLVAHLEGDEWIKDNGQYVNVAIQGNKVIIIAGKDKIGFIQEHNFKIVIDSNKAESVEINAHITTDYGFEKGLEDKMHELSADGKLNLYIPSGTSKSDASFSKAIQAALLNVLKTTDYKDVDLLTSALRTGNYITVNRAPNGKDLDTKEWKWESPKDTTFIFLLANDKKLNIIAQFNLYVGF